MTTQTISSDIATSPSSSTRRLSGLVRRGGISTLVALAGALGTRAVADAATGGLFVDQGDGSQQVGAMAVVFATIIGGAAGTGLAALAGRFLARPRRAFLAVCSLGLVGYATVPFAAAETTSIAIWLNVLHLVVAVAVVGGLARFLPANRR